MKNRNDTLKEIDIDKICSDKSLKTLSLCDLMNEIERLVKENRELKEENKKGLRDEIAKLKGHNPKPEIKPSKLNNKTEVPKRWRGNSSNNEEGKVNKTIRIDRREKINSPRECECGNRDPKKFYSKGRKRGRNSGYKDNHQ